MADKFLTLYHPPFKTANLQKEITHFAHEEDETIRVAWERYTSLFLKCPNHGFNDAFKVGTFYRVLFHEDKQLIDSVCGGNMLGGLLGGPGEHQAGVYMLWTPSHLSWCRLCLSWSQLSIVVG
ncbi:unnamed protein product [Linum trigynum]|uniref:Retrotransposon gag domain-containing protein n=1 Tax=Linum trigynum TaxID=586398 RepID=A0AAV2E6J9_9ROSI